MVKKIAFLLICLIMNSCQAQQKNTEQYKSSAGKSRAQEDYFIGSWKFVEKKYLNGSETKLYPLHECMKEYTLVFEKQRSVLFLTKNYTTGKNCSIKSTSGRISITLSENTFSYLDADLKRTEYYKIIAKNRFSIVYKDILDGKVKEIEDIYERK